MTGSAPLVRYGLVAGAEGAGMLWPVRADDAAPLERSAPVAVAVAALRDLGARFVLAEVAGGPAQVALIGALHEQAFADAARIADFVDDGVDLHILRLDLVP